MEKKYQIIYIWSFIIISGIILLLLYTPLGGDLHDAAYREQGRYTVSPGVNYSSQVGSFSGAGSSSGSSSTYGPSQSAYISPSFQGVVGGGFSSSSSPVGSSGSMGNGGGISLSNKKINSGGGGMSGGGFGFGMGGQQAATEVTSTFSGGGNIGGSLFGSTTINNGGVMQRGEEDENDPLDSGGDPTGPPLPIGDELGILLLFAGMFAFYKWLRITKK